VAYLGNDLQVAFPTYRNIDDISGSFNGVTTSFPLTVDGVAPIPAPVNSQQCLISVNGVVQRPDDSGAEGFLLSGGNIVFASAPAGGVDFFGVILAGADYINIGANFPSGTALVPSITFDSDLDTGIYNPAGNQIGFTTAGVQRLVINSSGQVSGGLGSATTPAFSFLSDPNTGIYSPGADQVAVATNGTGRLFVDASGRVGIGNSSPGSLLTARSTSSPTISIENNSSAGSGVVLFRSGGTNYGLQDRINIKGLITDSATGATALTVETSAGDLASPAERLRITAAGLVGIGTSDVKGALGLQHGNTSPQGLTDVAIDALRINQGVGGSIAIRATQYDSINQPAAGDTQFFNLFYNGSNYNWYERMRITAAGNVGIGTTSPQHPLHVIGGSSLNNNGANSIAVTGTEHVRLKINTPTTGGYQATLALSSDEALNSTSKEVTISTAGSSEMRFATGGSERLRIDSSGRLLVGTSTSTDYYGATAKSYITDQGGANLPLALETFRNDSAGAYLVLSHSRSGTAGNYTILQSGDGLGLISFNGSDGTDLGSIGATIKAEVDGTPGANDMPGRLVFSTTADGASSPTERLRITSAGNVGIGTASPGSYEVSADNLVISDSGDAGISIVSGTSNSGNLFFASGTVGNDMFRGYIIYSHTSHGLSFGTNAQERFRCDSSGRLLVGTSSTNGSFNSAVQIAGSGVAGTQLISRFDNNAGAPNLYFAKSRGASVGTNTLVQSGDEVGNIGFYAADGTNYVPAAQIRADIDGTPGTNDMPGRLVFSTTADGASSPTERMRIASSGGFKVSNTGAYNLGSDIHEINHNVVGSAAFHVYHSAASTPYGYYFKFTGANPNDATSYVFGSFDNVNANIYTIYSNGTVSARSDAKFKKNIETTRNGYLEDLAQLRVVKYNWYNHDDDTPKELGFIAQEVEQVFPGLVSTVPDKDDQGNETGEVSKSIKTSVFTPMLVKALQEALERIETLEAEVAALKAQ
jgi:hypothetical protein